MASADHYPGIQYFIHDGGRYIVPHYTNASSLSGMLNLAREAAYRDLTENGASHAVYGVKHYDPETGALTRADIYSPAVLLSENDFFERTDAEAKKSPGCLILALHARSCNPK